MIDDKKIFNPDDFKIFTEIYLYSYNGSKFDN